MRHIDRFKNINEGLGRSYGDYLLATLAPRLQRCLRQGDLVARLGGDKFAIFLDSGRESSDALRVVERINDELIPPFNRDGQEVFATASIGIAFSATGFSQPEDVLRNAETAMYCAKAQGTSRHQVFAQEMHDQAVKRVQLETDLRRAIEGNELRVYYQPIVALETGTLSGFEALVRWQHPVRGLVPPAEFIPVAEETGMIVPLGQWVLAESCRQMCEWQAQLPAKERLTLSVNLSGKQFTQPDLVKQIQQVLRETGFDPCRLQLEITESVAMENAETTAAMLTQLRTLGVQSVIDDFGTGYSSLSYLHRFPVSVLKIDRSFISRIGTGDGTSEIASTIVILASKLGLAVVAEGIETQAQMQELTALNCQYGQGYLFSKPIDSEAASALMHTQQQPWQTTLPCLVGADRQADVELLGSDLLM